MRRLTPRHVIRNDFALRYFFNSSSKNFKFNRSGIFFSLFFVAGVAIVWNLQKNKKKTHEANSTSLLTLIAFLYLFTLTLEKNSVDEKSKIKSLPPREAADCIEKFFLMESVKNLKIEKAAGIDQNKILLIRMDRDGQVHVTIQSGIFKKTSIYKVIKSDASAVFEKIAKTLGIESAGISRLEINSYRMAIKFVIGVYSPDDLLCLKNKFKGYDIELNYYAPTKSWRVQPIHISPDSTNKFLELCGCAADFKSNIVTQEMFDKIKNNLSIVRENVKFFPLEKVEFFDRRFVLTFNDNLWLPIYGYYDSSDQKNMLSRLERCGIECDFPSWNELERCIIFNKEPMEKFITLLNQKNELHDTKSCAPSIFRAL